MTALLAELLTIGIVVIAVCWIVALERRAVVDEAEADEAGVYWDQLRADWRADEKAVRR